MPAATLRIIPARSISLWLSISASAGLSRSVGAKQRDIFMASNPLGLSVSAEGELSVFEDRVVEGLHPFTRVHVGFVPVLLEVRLVGVRHDKGVHVVLFKKNARGVAVAPDDLVEVQHGVVVRPAE